jgi:CheY-like chemotaxis protein
MIPKTNPYILIVDDDPNDQFFLTLALKDVLPHCTTRCFSNGIDLLEYLFGEQRKPDLVFLDVNMGQLGGVPTLKVIRFDKGFAKIPVIIFTGAENLLEKEKLIDLGANAFYTKPDSINALKKIMKEVADHFLCGVS